MTYDDKTKILLLGDPAIFTPTTSISSTSEATGDAANFGLEGRELTC